MSTLGSLLVKNKVVGVVDIEKALQRQVIYGGDLATNLLELSLAKEEQVAKYVGQAFVGVGLNGASIHQTRFTSSSGSAWTNWSNWRSLVS